MSTQTSAFKSLGLSEKILKAIKDQGYENPTSIQEQAIPLVIEGKDLLACSQTGSGKTAGFTLPILHLLSNKKSQTRGVRALILTPTRELAAQVKESVDCYSAHLSLKSAAVFGGVNIVPQIKKLRAGVDVLVATPGRLLDHVSQRTVDLSNVEIFVLDEADRMLDMGFIQDIERIIGLLSKERQSLLFSATFSPPIKKLASRLLNSPVTLEAHASHETPHKVEQAVYPVDSKRKQELLSFLINSNNWKQVLVFTRTKHGANKLAFELEKDGIRAAEIHSNKTQAARMKALANFKKGSVNVLVATDIAARGIDIDLLPNVVNFDLPHVPEDYVHRIGRTGRAGNEGQAISLVCVDEHKLLKGIEYLLKQPIPKVIVPGFEPDPSIRPEPIFARRGRGGGQGGSRSSGPRERGSRGSFSKRPPRKFGEERGERRREKSDDFSAPSEEHFEKRSSNRERDFDAPPKQTEFNERRKEERGNLEDQRPRREGGFNEFPRKSGYGENRRSEQGGFGEKRGRFGEGRGGFGGQRSRPDTGEGRGSFGEKRGRFGEGRGGFGGQRSRPTGSEDRTRFGEERSRPKRDFNGSSGGGEFRGNRTERRSSFGGDRPKREGGFGEFSRKTEVDGNRKDAPAGFGGERRAKRVSSFGEFPRKPEYNGFKRDDRSKFGERREKTPGRPAGKGSFSGKSFARGPKKNPSARSWD